MTPFPAAGTPRLDEGDRTIKDVCADARIGRTTLEGWLATDLLRPCDDRRFQFHRWRGRKRIWSPAAYRQLIDAIERESEPGGVLAGRGGVIAAAAPVCLPPSTKAVQSALDAVLGFPLRPKARRNEQKSGIKTEPRAIPPRPTGG